MIDVTELLYDPDFCSPFTVERYSGKWEKGRYYLGEPTLLQWFHPVQPATPEELEQIPEGDRKTGMMKFFCVKPKEFHLSDSGNQVSDKIRFNGQRYKIVQIMPWDMNGWQRAFAHPIEEGETK